jgi:hypothetical protein
MWGGERGQIKKKRRACQGGIIFAQTSDKFETIKYPSSLPEEYLPQLKQSIKLFINTSSREC